MVLAFRLSTGGPGHGAPAKEPYVTAICRIQRKERHSSKSVLNSGELWVFSGHQESYSVLHRTQRTPEGQRSEGSTRCSGNAENQNAPHLTGGWPCRGVPAGRGDWGQRHKLSEPTPHLERPSFASHFGFAQASEAWHSDNRGAGGSGGCLTVTARPWIVTVCHAGRTYLLRT